MTKRWKQRPPGSTWGDWGDDDELGRINLVTPEKVLQGVREVEAGISFCLSLPLDFPGGTALNQRRHPPVLAPTEDMEGNPATFYNVHMSEMADFGDAKYVDVWADDVVTLSLQYSTQWDSLAHVGAEFDADGDGVEEAVYYNGYRAGVDLVGPLQDAAGDGGRHRSFARHLGLEHMAFHGVQGRGVLVDLAHHLGHDWQGVDLQTLQESWPRTAWWSSRATCSCCTPASPPRCWPGTATPIPARSTPCARTSTPGTRRCSAGSPTRRSRRWRRTTTRSRGCWARTATRAGTRSSPIHHLCLFRLGVPLGEMWYLHELATWLREHGRSRFLLTAPPLRLPGAVGSPLTPVATV